MMYPYATLYVGASQNDMTPLPEPKKGGFKVLLQDVDAATTTRSADGTMLRDRLCGGATSKRKLEIEWEKRLFVILYSTPNNIFR